MEIANHHQGGGGGFMKSKLILSLYRAAKPSPSVQYTKVESEAPSLAVQKVSLSSKPGGGGGFSTWDGYVHGVKGFGGDERVNAKPTSYIHEVKEGHKLEEMSINDSNVLLIYA